MADIKTELYFSDAVNLFADYKAAIVFQYFFNEYMKRLQTETEDAETIEFNIAAIERYSLLTRKTIKSKVKDLENAGVISENNDTIKVNIEYFFKSLALYSNADNENKEEICGFFRCNDIDKLNDLGYKIKEICISVPEEISTLKNLHLGKFPPGKIPTCKNVQVGKCLPGNFSTWENSHLVKSSPGKIPRSNTLNADNEDVTSNLNSWIRNITTEADTLNEDDLAKMIIALGAALNGLSDEKFYKVCDLIAESQYFEAEEVENWMEQLISVGNDVKKEVLVRRKESIQRKEEYIYNNNININNISKISSKDRRNNNTKNIKVTGLIEDNNERSELLDSNPVTSSDNLSKEEYNERSELYDDENKLEHDERVLRKDSIGVKGERKKNIKGFFQVQVPVDFEDEEEDEQNEINHSDCFEEDENENLEDNSQEDEEEKTSDDELTYFGKEEYKQMVAERLHLNDPFKYKPRYTKDDLIHFLSDIRNCLDSQAKLLIYYTLEGMLDYFQEKRSFSEEQLRCMKEDGLEPEQPIYEIVDMLGTVTPFPLDFMKENIRGAKQTLSEDLEAGNVCVGKNEKGEEVYLDLEFDERELKFDNPEYLFDFSEAQLQSDGSREICLSWDMFKDVDAPDFKALPKELEQMSTYEELDYSHAAMYILFKADRKELTPIERVCHDYLRRWFKPCDELRLVEGPYEDYTYQITDEDNNPIEYRKDTKLRSEILKRLFIRGVIQSCEKEKVSYKLFEEAVHRPPSDPGESVEFIGKLPFSFTKIFHINARNRWESKVITPENVREYL